MVLVFLGGESVVFALHACGFRFLPRTSVVPAWRETMQLFLGVSSMVVVIAACVLFIRRRAAWHASPAVANPVRKQLLKQVRGQRALVLAQLPEVRDLAQSLVDRRVISLLLPFGMALCLSGQTVASSSFDPWLNVFDAFIVMGLFTGVLLTARDARHASRFLDRNWSGGGGVPGVLPGEAVELDGQPDPAARTREEGPIV
jgi:hypothetical protein